MPSPRIPGLEENWIATMHQSYAELLAQHLAAIPVTPEERLIYAWDAVANDYRQLALVLYASGEQLERVRALFGEAARTHLKMVSMRGIENTSPASTISSAYATGNSCSTLRALCMALTAGEINVAVSLASLMWDLPNAPYIAANSVLCTDKEQTLAYATKYLLLDRKDLAEAQLNRLALIPEDIVGKLLMLRGLVRNEASDLLKGMAMALAWHKRVAATEENSRVPDYFLCIPALGLIAYALRLRLVVYEQLPENNVYFPRDLIAN